MRGRVRLEVREWVRLQVWERAWSGVRGKARSEVRVKAKLVSRKDIKKGRRSARSRRHCEDGCGD